MSRARTTIGAVALLLPLLLVLAAASATAQPTSNAFTPILIDVVAARTGPVRGDDGRVWVVYELLVTNAKAAPATVERLQVVDADHPGVVVHELEGDDLAAATRRLNASSAPSTPLAQDESRLVFVEISFARWADVPRALLHRLSGMGAANPAARQPSPLSYLVAPVRLDRFTAPALEAPLRGEGWVVTNGCCETTGRHRSALQSVNGALYNSQRFAIDWLKLDELDRFVVGDPSVLRNWVGYDEPVLAVADGVVVATGDGLDDQPPGTLPDPSTITLDTVNGNFVVLEVGRGLHVFYAHLRKGTVAVERGDSVRAGDVLGRLGNSGNTSAPHLHLHLMNGPSPLGSDGLPFVHRSFTLTGAVDPVQWEESADLTGTWGNRDEVRRIQRSMRLPLDLGIVTFPR